MIQVRGERVLSENRLIRKRQSDRKRKEVKGVKRVEKNAQESQRGHQNRQNTTGGTRKRTRKDINKKTNIYRRAGNARKKYKDAPENRLIGGHQQREANYKGPEKEEEVSRVLSGFSLTLRPRKIQTFFTNRRLILASV